MTSRESAEDCDSARHVQSLPAASVAPDGEIAPDSQQDREFHDLRATLAIVNGFAQALDGSFVQLKQKYDDLLSQNTSTDTVDDMAELRTLEADCRFCLSRLLGSVDQLRERLDRRARIPSAVEDGGR